MIGQEVRPRAAPPADTRVERARARAIAFYLPQYHPVPENDEWWGKGFTEWTNTAKAKPRFPGHYQPHVPADLGFYDLRSPETRAAQAQMAREYGIEAFCYYHYWFAGRRIIDRPFREVLESGEPEFPFCLCWANESWTGVWHGLPNRVLLEQTYPGADDHRRHFDFLVQAFCDPRHVRVEGKPLFLVYKPLMVPEVERVTDLWRKLAMDAGLPGLYLIGVDDNAAWPHRDFGFDGSVKPELPPRRPWAPWRQPVKKVWYKLKRMAGVPTVHDYRRGLARLVEPRPPGTENYPCVIPNWDNTPRSGEMGLVLHNSRPEYFREQVERAVSVLAAVPEERRLLFIKSWNEWAEGNHLEPDLRWGRAYLKALRSAVVE